MEIRKNTHAANMMEVVNEDDQSEYIALDNGQRLLKFDLQRYKNILATLLTERDPFIKNTNDRDIKELIKKFLDSKYILPGMSRLRLQELQILDDFGNIREEVKNIVYLALSRKKKQERIFAVNEAEIAEIKNTIHEKPEIVEKVPEKEGHQYRPTRTETLIKEARKTSSPYASFFSASTNWDHHAVPNLGDKVEINLPPAAGYPGNKLIFVKLKNNKEEIYSYDGKCTLNKPPELLRLHEQYECKDFKLKALKFIEIKANDLRNAIKRLNEKQYQHKFHLEFHTYNTPAITFTSEHRYGKDIYWANVLPGYLESKLSVLGKSFENIFYKAWSQICLLQSDYPELLRQIEKQGGKCSIKHVEGQPKTVLTPRMG